jgi:hypothetical protein
MQVENEPSSSQMQVEDKKEQEEVKQEEAKQENPVVQQDIQMESAQEVQPASTEPIEEPLDENQIRINNVLEAFNVTREQVVLSGIDIEVLAYLPEFELVTILSEVASNIALQPEPVQEQPEVVVAQPEVPAQNEIINEQVVQEPAQNVEVENQEQQPQVVVDQNQPLVVPQQPNQPVQVQPTPPAQSQPLPGTDNVANDPMLQSFFSNLLGTGTGVGGMNPPASQPNIATNTLDIQALESMIMGMNQAQTPANNPPNPFAIPSPFPMGGARPSNLFNFPSPPNPFAGGNPVPPVAQNPLPVQSNPPAQANPNLPDGIDQEFFNQLPEDIQQEMLRDSEMMRRNMGQPPVEVSQAQPEAMDTASFLATLTDDNLRREILVGMDEQTLATLPPHLQTEARRHQREIQRRHFRRDRDQDPARMLRRMMERHGRDGEPIGRPNRRENPKESKEKYDNFMEIIKRREEKYSKASPEALDISKNTINVVFSDDKNLKNLMKMIIVESQRKTKFKFETLTKPFENL